MAAWGSASMNGQSISLDGIAARFGAFTAARA
jgi:hypothetical protein